MDYLHAKIIRYNLKFRHRRVTIFVTVHLQYHINYMLECL
jgi:hypothetical protein